MSVGSGLKRGPIALMMVVTTVLTACTSAGTFTTGGGGSSSVGEPLQRLMHMAESAEQSGDFDLAANFYANGLKRDPDNPILAFRLGEALMAGGHATAAAEAFAKAVKLDPDSLEAAKAYAKALIADGRGKQALAQVLSWYRKRQDDIDLINLMGVAYDLRGQHLEAHSIYRRGLERDPASVSLRNNYGLSLAFAGDTDRAIEVLKGVVESPDTNERSRQNLALAYGLAGDLEAAERLSRIDLPEEAVKNNIEYLALLTGKKERTPTTKLEPFPKKAMIQRSEPARAPAAPLQPPKPLVPEGLATGHNLMLSAPPARPWFIDLGGFATNTRAAVRWRELAREHPEALQGLNRLAGGGGSEVRLVAGAFASKDQAAAACRRLNDDRCRPVKL